MAASPAEARRGRGESRVDRRDRRARRATAYVALDTRACEACWECVDACPNEVLGRLSVLFHRHARIVAAMDCTGCLACVRACESGALSRLRAEPLT